MKPHSDSVVDWHAATLTHVSNATMDTEINFRRNCKFYYHTAPFEGEDRAKLSPPPDVSHQVQPVTANWWGFVSRQVPSYTGRLGYRFENILLGIFYWTISGPFSPSLIIVVLFQEISSPINKVFIYCFDCKTISQLQIYNGELSFFGLLAREQSSLMRIFAEALQ